MRRTGAIVSPLGALVIGLAASRAAWPAQGGRPAIPFPVLFDTRTASPGPLAPQALAARRGWAEVPKANTAHTFAGDAVFLNDRIAVVLRRKGAGADVYAWADPGAKHRALLTPLSGSKQPASALSTLRIVENAQGAVELEAGYAQGKGKPFSARFRLTTGDMTLGVRSGEGTGCLRLEARTRFVVVPDYFGDDRVYRADSLPSPTIGLPAENFFLGLIDGSDAILMCVWDSPRRGARIVRAPEGQPRRAPACEVDCAKGETTWLGVLEGPSIWHSRVIEKEDANRDVALTWRPPFAAKWRGVFAGPLTGPRSHWLEDSHPGGEGLWLKDGRTFVRAGLGDLAVVYPLDRSRKTPLTAYCPTDVLRSSLGVGPCQYALDLEGLASETIATPGKVVDWTLQQFRRKRAKRRAAQIKARLAQMVAHVRRTDGRLAKYIAFGRELRGAAKKTGTNSRQSAFASDVRALSQQLVRAPSAPKAPDEAAQLAEQLAALTGREPADDTLTAATRHGALLIRIGAAQNRALARCRMTLRRIRQMCLSAGASAGPPRKLAATIREMTERMLWRK